MPTPRGVLFIYFFYFINPNTFGNVQEERGRERQKRLRFAQSVLTTLVILLANKLEGWGWKINIKMQNPCVRVTLPKLTFLIHKLR